MGPKSRGQDANLRSASLSNNMLRLFIVTLQLGFIYVPCRCWSNDREGGQGFSWMLVEALFHLHYGGASCFPILSKRISAWCSVYTPAGQHMKSRYSLRPGHLQVSKLFQGWLTVLQTLPMASHLQHPLNHLPHAALGLFRASWI